MEKYAVIKLMGHQYKIIEGQTLNVDRLPNKEGEKIELKEVLLYKDGANLSIGTPFLTDIPVIVKVEKHLKGDKLDVYKYKSKVRYRRHIGFRPFLTQLLIEKIGNSKSKEENKVSPEKVKKELKPVKTGKTKSKKAS